MLEIIFKSIQKQRLLLEKYVRPERNTMKTLRFKKIDAFASKKSSGNPTAVVYLDSPEDLTSTEMLQIAKELQGYVSEVGYVSPGTDTDYQLRYFSAEREVAFCGHATIAILNDIIANNKSMQTKPTLSIATQNDLLTVENHYEKDKCVYISAPAPRFSTTTIDKTDIASALNCPADMLEMSRPTQIVNAGLETLVVPMTNLKAILFVTPDLDILKEFCVQIGVDIIILYTDETSTVESRYRTRVFAPTYGYLEDPATGSGNAALGYYLLRNNMWKGESVKIEQNGYLDTPNFVQIRSKKIDENNNQVWFGGGAVLKIDGQYLLS
jgi:PhzF family phenazine biosynthesis protein